MNADRGLAAEVPGDALYYSEAGNIGAAWAAVIEPIKQAVASTPEGAEQIQTCEAALGADLEELVSWIDDGRVAIGCDGSQPYGGLVLVPNDVEAAQRRLGQLGYVRIPGSAGPAERHQRRGGRGRRHDRDDHPLGGPWMPAVETFGMPMAGGVVLEVRGDRRPRAASASATSSSRRVLELDAADSLAQVPRYADAVAAMGGAENTAVTWLDLAGTREALETAFGSMIESVDPDGLVRVRGAAVAHAAGPGRQRHAASRASFWSSGPYSWSSDVRRSAVPRDRSGSVEPAGGRGVAPARRRRGAVRMEQRPGRPRTPRTSTRPRSCSSARRARSRSWSALTACRSSWRRATGSSCRPAPARGDRRARGLHLPRGPSPG